MMQKYALVDGSGDVVSLGVVEEADLPVGAILIPRYENLDDYINRNWDGSVWTDNTVVPDPTEEAETALAVAKDAALLAVTERISFVRLQFITDIPGQELVYKYKAEQAQDYIDFGLPADLTNYPLIAAEIGTSSGATAADVANTFLAREAQLQQIATVMEGVRRVFIDALDVATDVSGVETARDTALAALNTSVFS
jgi:hypothetical protein